MFGTARGHEPHILSPLCSTKIPGSEAVPACTPGFLNQLLLSALLGCWLDELTPHESFCLGRWLPSRLQGSLEVLNVPRTNVHSPVPSLWGLPWSQIAVFRGGSEVLSYPTPAPLREASASLSSVMWLLWLSEDFCAFGVFSIAIWLLLFVVCWKGESPGQEHCAMMLMSLPYFYF